VAQVDVASESLAPRPIFTSTVTELGVVEQLEASTALVLPVVTSNLKGMGVCSMY
jgi:hypothetical protein